MAVETPNSYKDPYWTDLASGTEQKLGLPKGLLVAVLTRGERSNADQVSEDGAKTPFQIIPATRKAAIDKYGIDPYLSPENAAEVSGRLLQDSLKRNGGDPAAAVAEYHGGTDRMNWGPRTKAYVQRVIGAQPAPVSDPGASTTTTLPPGPDPMQPTPAGQSTFDRVSAALGKPGESAIANVYKAYSSGQMDPKEQQQFESDVKAGRIMLPRGATLNGAAATSSGPTMLPAGVADAYRQGKMSETDRAQLEADVRAGLVRLPAIGPDAIPGAADPNAAILAPKAPAPSMLDKLAGAGEAALSTATGATTGTIGQIVGGANQMGQDILNYATGNPISPTTVQQAAEQGGAALTYSPRTAVGQDLMQDVVAPAVQNLVPLAGIAGTLPHAAGAARAAVQPAAELAQATLPRAVQAVRNGVGAVVDRVAPGAAEPTPTPGTLGSAGAAATDMAAQRTATAANLPVPIKLTAGQASRDFEQLRFEKETAKDPTRGAALRERGEQQNADILKNFDAWLDQTGAEAPDVVAAGRAVNSALVERAARDKAQVRAAYKSAEKAGEMADPVNLDALVAHLNEAAPEAATAPLINTARNLAVKLGIAEEQGGKLVPADSAELPNSSIWNSQAAAPRVTLKTAETFRQAINRNTDFEPTNVRQAAIIKGLVDDATQGQGGDIYRAARALRTRYAQLYEDRAVISDLLSNRKGMADPKVPVDRVFQRSILQGSPEDARFLRQVLQTGGENGKQAWREMQGATLNHIREQATRGVTTDQRGNPVISPAGLNRAVQQLDKDGRLQIVFGKQGAQQLRDINEISKFVNTAPPGTVNSSNTASVLLAALAEAGVSGSMTGIPVPVLSLVRAAVGHAKDRRIQQRVVRALNNEAERQARPTGSRPKPVPPTPRNIH